MVLQSLGLNSASQIPLSLSFLQVSTSFNTFSTHTTVVKLQHLRICQSKRLKMGHQRGHWSPSEIIAVFQFFGIY